MLEGLPMIQGITDIAGNLVQAVKDSVVYPEGHEYMSNTDKFIHGWKSLGNDVSGYVMSKIKKNPRVIEDNLNEGLQGQDYGIEGPGNAFVNTVVGPGNTFVQVPQPSEQTKGPTVPQAEFNRFGTGQPKGILETLFGSSTKHNEL